jgi:hypothetical protein
LPGLLAGEGGMSRSLSTIHDLFHEARYLGRSARTAPVVVRVQESANQASYVEVPIKELLETPGGALALVVEVSSCCPSHVDPLKRETWPERAA